MSKATDDLVDRFAAALKEKLTAAEAKYGFDDNWTEEHWQSELVADLIRHVYKGDPRDVAAFCAFAWHHGWSVSPPRGDVERLVVAVRRFLDTGPKFDDEIQELDDAVETFAPLVPYDDELED